MLLGTYLPGYKAGGPLRTIENLVATLGQEFVFKIVTLDRDLGETSPYPGIVANKWVRVGHADVLYLKPGLRGLVNMWALLRSVDRQTVLYLNSFFARHFSMLPALMRWLRLCRPQSLVLAPRGEFSRGALALKRVQKSVYLRIARGLGVYRRTIWHASSEFEAQDIRRQFPGLKGWEAMAAASDPALSGVRGPSVIMTAVDLGAPQARPQSSRQKKAGELRLVFVGRCSRMKNLSGHSNYLRA